MAEHYEKLTNEVLPKVAHDKQAKIGCKGENKYWYGFTSYQSVDRQSGLINKVAITPANVTDAKGFKHVCPDAGAVYADKGYWVKPARHTAARKGVYLAAVKSSTSCMALSLHEKEVDIILIGNLTSAGTVRFSA